MVLFSDDGLRHTTLELESERFKLLGDNTRLEILDILGSEETYPADVAKKIDASKQKVYYHFKRLEEADLIREKSTREISGGSATIYEPVSDSFVFSSRKGQKSFVPPTDKTVEKFLEPLIDEGELKGKVVVGSPDEHGPDQVRARDGHLSSEIGMKLGNYCKAGDLTVMDTDTVRQDLFDKNLLILGGILTNTVAKKFNEEFPVSFSGESFPYRKLETPESSYTSENIGVISKAVNPIDTESRIFLVAGIRGEGTRAAVEAFKNLEDIVGSYEGGDFYVVVKGLDMDGDGKIDSYEVIEK